MDCASMKQNNYTQISVKYGCIREEHYEIK